MVKEKYENGAVDFKPILSKVKAAPPDVIYMVSYVMDASLLMKQIKELRIDAKLFAGGAAGFAIPELLTMPRMLRNMSSATLWTPQVKYPGAKEYAEKYKKITRIILLITGLKPIRPSNSSRTSWKGQSLDA